MHIILVKHNKLKVNKLRSLFEKHFKHNGIYKLYTQLQN